MTSSETLGSSGPTYDFRRPVLAWAERFPNLLCLSVLSVPSSVPRQTERLHLAVSSSSALAFPISVEGRHLQIPRAPVPAWLCNEAAKFTLWYGPEELLALHRPGRLRSSFHLLSRLKQASNITTRVNSQLPRPDLHRQDTQHYGLQTEITEKSASNCPDRYHRQSVHFLSLRSRSVISVASRLAHVFHVYATCETRAAALPRVLLPSVTPGARLTHLRKLRDKSRGPQKRGSALRAECYEVSVFLSDCFALSRGFARCGRNH